MTIIPSWLMSSSRPTNGEMSDAPALAARRPWLAVKISVQLVLMPSSAKRLIASSPFSDIATLTTMFGARVAKCRPSSSIPSTSSDTTSAETGPGVILQTCLEDLVVRAADLGVQGRVGRHAVEHAPAGGGLDLVDVGGVQEDLHGAGSSRSSSCRGDSTPVDRDRRPPQKRSASPRTSAVTGPIASAATIASRPSPRSPGSARRGGGGWPAGRGPAASRRRTASAPGSVPEPVEVDQPRRPEHEALRRRARRRAGPPRSRAASRCRAARPRRHRP